MVPNTMHHLAEAALGRKRNLATEVGRLILRARTERGWSLVELAKRSGRARGFLTFVENGRRGASPQCLMDVAVAFGMDPLLFLVASYRDELAKYGLGRKIPAGDEGTQLFEYLGARALQERQFDFAVAELVHTATVSEDGVAVVERRYRGCRPNQSGRIVREIELADRIVGGTVPEYGGDVFEILQKPAHLEMAFRNQPSGQGLRHFVEFPEGWARASAAKDDEVSFLYRRSYPAFARTSEEYVKKFTIERPEQPFEGRISLYLPYLAHRLTFTVMLPRQPESNAWRLRIRWGARGNALQDLAPEGFSRKHRFGSGPYEATATFEQPLAGYSVDLIWTQDSTNESAPIPAERNA